MHEGSLFSTLSPTHAVRFLTTVVLTGVRRYLTGVFFALTDDQRHRASFRVPVGPLRGIQLLCRLLIGLLDALLLSC